MTGQQSRTAAATRARRAIALRKRLIHAAAMLREHGYVVLTGEAACPSCRGIDKTARKIGRS